MPYRAILNQVFVYATREGVYYGGGGGVGVLWDMWYITQFYAYSCRVGIYGKVFTMIVRTTLIKDLILLNVKFKPPGFPGGRLLLVSQSNKLYMSTTSTTKRLYGTVTTSSSDVLFDSYENITS